MYFPMFCVGPSITQELRLYLLLNVLTYFLQHTLDAAGFRFQSHDR